MLSQASVERNASPGVPRKQGLGTHDVRARLSAQEVMMGLFDDAVPGGNITKPILIALGALLAGKLLSGGSRQQDEDVDPQAQQLPPVGTAPHQQIPQRTAPPAEDNGGLLGGGLGELLERLAKQGQGETVDSWVGKGENKPVQPGDLGSAIGGNLLSELSRRTGIPEDQLLEQLSKALPSVVDKLTPNGSVPSQDQVAGQFRNSPW